MPCPVKVLVLLPVACLVVSLSFCQQANNWYFGNHAGLSFTGGAPSPLTDGAINTLEGCTSISDDNGRLLFYTDGVSVWNRLHQVMPNGAGLKGNTSTANSAIIVPKPGSNTIYYIFTADAIENNLSKGYNFSEVDMALDGGRGDITVHKNILLYTPCTEKLSAVRDANGIDVWVVTKQWGNSDWSAYKVDCHGVNTTPVISTAGSIHNEMAGGFMAGASGCIKISPDGAYIANARPFTGRWELLRFDNAGGRVSGGLSIPAFSAYGAEFSPGSKYVYVNAASGRDICQYDLSVYDSAALETSKTAIGTTPGGIGSLQLAPDSKIYCSSAFSTLISVINAPDSPGLACNFRQDQIDLAPGRCTHGLPACLPDLIIGRRADFTQAPDNSRCATVSFAGSTQLTGPLIWQWDFGDGTGGTGQQTVHTYAGGDSVLVKMTVSTTTACGETVTATTMKKIPVPNVQITAGFTHTAACLQMPVVFTDTSVAADITDWQWDFGDGTRSQLQNPVHTYNAAGNYAVRHSVKLASGCTADIIKTVTVPLVTVNAGNDTMAAIGQPLQLQATGAVTYTWSPATWLDNAASPAPVAKPESDITYHITGVTADGCTGEDSVHIKVYKGPDIYVPGAFTPDGNGHNDLLKPIIPGVRSLHYFAVYNRLGQLLFKTSTPGQGWDGTVNGVRQPSGTFVWIIRLTDYQGRTWSRTGTTLLIR